MNQTVNNPLILKLVDCEEGDGGECLVLDFENTRNCAWLVVHRGAKQAAQRIHSSDLSVQSADFQPLECAYPIVTVSPTHPETGDPLLPPSDLMVQTDGTHLYIILEKEVTYAAAFRYILGMAWTGVCRPAPYACKLKVDGNIEQLCADVTRIQKRVPVLARLFVVMPVVAMCCFALSVWMFAQ